MKKFTFKTHHPTGRYRSFDHDYHDIKYNKVVVGSIANELPHKISLQVMKDDIMEDGSPNCKWKWIKLKKEFTSVEEAKKFLNDNVDAVMTLNLKLEDI